MLIPLRTAQTLWSSSNPAQLPYGRRAVPKMPVPDGEDVSLRQAHAEEPTLLAGRCPLWSDLRRTAQVRFAHVPEELSPTWRLRGRLPTVSTSVRETQDFVRSPMHRSMPRAVPMPRENSLSDHSRGNMWLWPAPPGPPLQRGKSRRRCQGPATAATASSLTHTVNLRRGVLAARTQPFSGLSVGDRNQPLDDSLQRLHCW